METTEIRAFIYVLYTDTIVQYIGVSVNPEKRFKHHLSEAFNTNGKEYNLKKSRWIRKNSERVKMKLIYSGNESDCYLKEKQLINLAKSKNRNLKNSAEGGKTPPRINTLPDFKSIVEKIRLKANGRVASESTKRKMSDSHRRSLHLRVKQNVSGINNPNAKKVVQKSKTGEVIKIWDYAKMAVDSLNLSYSAISKCVTGATKSAGGYCWELYEKELKS